ncbi:MAG: hypothetical protein LBJ47_06865, partial [Tannerella sp.]|nr:hypothetical protein [Tannerella sp.]
EEIVVTVTAGGTGNETVGTSSVQATCFNGVLTVTSPSDEQVELYSTSGALIYGTHKTPGTVTCRIGHLPHGVLVVRGASGWSRKVMLN